MANQIQRVKDRDALLPRREPYWITLRVGHYLGFRKIAATSSGTWLARHRDRRTGEQVRRPLGKFDHLPDAERYDAAKLAAEAWFDHLGSGGAPEALSVRQACERYVMRQRREKGDKVADATEHRFRRLVYGARIADLQLDQLNKRDVAAWRENLEQRPAAVSRSPRKKDTRDRSKATINRDMTPLRAALNLAYEDGFAASVAIWETALRPYKNAAGRRTLYLDSVDRRKLLACAAEEIRPFLEGLARLPLRPGALAALRVEQFDSRLGTITIGDDKGRGGRRLKLPPAMITFLAQQARGKLPGAPLISRANGLHWDKDSWKKPIKQAAARASLPAATTAYTLRHSTITDLVVGGLDLLTVAQISGTSVAMIEAHYGHLQQDLAADALARLAL